MESVCRGNSTVGSNPTLSAIPAKPECPACPELPEGIELITDERVEGLLLFLPLTESEKIPHLLADAAYGVFEVRPDSVVPRGEHANHDVAILALE